MKVNEDKKSVLHNNKKYTICKNFIISDNFIISICKKKLFNIFKLEMESVEYCNILLHYPPGFEKEYNYIVPERNDFIIEIIFDRLNTEGFKINENNYLLIAKYNGLYINKDKLLEVLQSYMLMNML